MIFFQEVSVDFDGLDKLVGTIGVTTALTMSLAIAMPLSLTAQDYDDTISRFAASPYDNCESAYNLIEKYNRLMCMSVYFHAFTIVGLILVSMFISAVSKTITYMDHEDAKRLCFIIKIPVRLASMTLVIGIIYLFLTFQYHIILTMPNYYVVRTGKCPTSHGDVDARQAYYPENTWMFSMLLRDVLGHLGYVLPLIFLSLAVPTIVGAENFLARNKSKITEKERNEDGLKYIHEHESAKQKEIITKESDASNVQSSECNIQ